MLTFTYHHTEYTYPARLSQLTLGQRIAFYHEHGTVLDAAAQTLATITDPAEQQLEQQLWYMTLATRSFAFYTGIPLSDVANDIPLADVLNIVNAAQLAIQEQQEITLQTAYEWNGETWHISSPELHTHSSMTFNEFIHAKEITRQLQALKKGKWDALPYLCAIYLRHENDPFTETLIAPNSPRITLMHTLPLEIALAVGFFLLGTMIGWQTPLASSPLTFRQAQ